jgi:hypothetical protein
VCGDDVHHPPIIQAVGEWFPGYTTEATLWIARLP